MKLFKNIVYVLSNHTSESSSSLIRAIDLAKSNQADLTLLRVLPDVSPFFKSNKVGISEQDLRNKVLEKERIKMQDLVASLNVGFSLKTEQVTGKRYIEIIRMVQTKDYDLVIKEADDIDWLDHLLGRDDMHLMRKCPCPIWLMKKDERLEYKHIIAAVDLNQEVEADTEDLNLMILESASLLSLSEFTALHVVNIYDVPLAGFISQWVEQPDKVEKALYDTEQHKRQQRMKILLANLKRKIGLESFNYVSPQTHLIQGTPDRELPKLADSLKADLVVMGTVARKGVAGLIIGNTAEAVLPQLQCSVLSIKPKSFGASVL
jgi:nucleotide-binding universal stress UspA family protein